MKIKLTSGFGLVKRNGVVIERFEFLPNSEHNFPDDVVAEELESRDQMEAVEVFKEPLSEKKIQDDLISKKMFEIQRREAVKELKQEGKLPADFVDKKN